VLKLVPSALPWTDRVCVRLSQPAGSFSTTSSTPVVLPMSACTHCGSVLPALCQYDDWSPSVTLAAAYSLCELLAVAGRPAAMSGPSAAEAVHEGRPSIKRLVVITAERTRHLQRCGLICPRSSAPCSGATRARL
jgi:hypothetical protein